MGRVGTTGYGGGLVALGLLAVAAGAQAETGKLRLTGGVSSVDGAAGGGITPWALIGTQATEGEVGVSLHRSQARTQDYALVAQGLTLAWHDRLELSLAQQDFDASPAVALNGIAPFGVQPGEHLRMDVLGLKWRLAGDAILDSDRAMPQVSLGVLHKRLHPGSLQSVLDFLGAQTQGNEVYLSATKLLLGPGVLLNGTLRWTQANQNGLLGFGAAAPGTDKARLQPEVSVAYLPRAQWAIGAEYRHKPDNLRRLGQAAGLGNALREDAWRDVFVAWAPSPHLSLTAAWVDLGRIVPGITAERRQTGGYLSAQVAF